MILEKVKKYIYDFQLLTNKEQVIVGVSGGADSVVLLHMLYSLGFDCIAAHCNFHLRGEESDRDASFVENLCKTYTIPFHKIDFDTHAYASKNSISIEMAARDLRYTWFEKLRKELNVNSIAVAHHRDDSVETVLLNLIRGTGIRGLTGISPKNNAIVRPLLCLNRNEVLEYLKENSLNCVEDSTNSEDIYTRNKIRLNVIPLLETINPSAKEAISKTSEHLNQVKNIYNLYIEQAKKEIFNKGKIDINKLLKYEEPKAILFEILYPYHFNASTISDIFETLESQSGKIFYSDTHQVLKDRDYLILKQKESGINQIFEIDEDTSFLSSSINLKIESIRIDSSFTLEKGQNIAYINKDKVKYPLIIRKWQQGDWFIPFGMKGKKKISDYFTDRKFSLFDKENTWLLCSGNDIVWIIGHRSDERYRIDNTTQEVLKITLNQ